MLVRCDRDDLEVAGTLCLVVNPPRRGGTSASAELQTGDGPAVIAETKANGVSA